MNKTYYIYSPSAPQSQALAGFISKYYPNSKIIGVFLPGEKTKALSALFNTSLRVEELNGSEGIHIPTGAESTERILRERDITLGDITLRQDILKVYDKIWFLNFCKEIGLPTPVTWTELNRVDAFPIFFKSNYEIGGGSRGKAESVNDVPKGKSLIFQEYINTQGTFSVAFLAINGELLTAFSQYEAESTPKDGGSAVIMKTFNEPRLIELTQKIIQQLKYSGWGLAEFKYCPRRKDYVIMEINAKFWASCEFAFLNEPKFLNLLFHIDSLEKSVNKMLFVNRVFQRGPLYTIRKFPLVLQRDTKLKVYKGTGESILTGILPAKMYLIVKKLYRSINDLKNNL